MKANPNRCFIGLCVALQR